MDKHYIPPWERPLEGPTQEVSKSEPPSPDTEYTVGYKRPPKTTQFKTGQSGNRKGRPKGAQNFMTVLEKELNTPVTLNEGGHRKKLCKRDVIAKQVVNKAATGDLKAISLLINETRAGVEVTTVSPIPITAEILGDDDQKVLANLLGRIKREIMEPPKPSTPALPNEDRELPREEKE